MTRVATAAAMAALTSVFLTQPTLAQPAPKLGKVNFDISCKPLAKRHFNRAMLYQHSFFYRASNQSFNDALKVDPDCAMAHWGIALSLLFNPHAPPPPPNLPLGLAAVQKGQAMAVKTQREREYLNALAVMYVDYEKIDHRTRLLAYAKAMETLAQRYPKDDEAQIHYALALNTSAEPTDKTYANQLKGAEILAPIIKRQPQHPGVTHYQIYLTDYPPIAEKGLPAARRYAKIAPAAPHAQHMPSHIFTRVGLWQDLIASNLASARSAKAEKEPDDQLHAMDYLVYAYLQTGQDKKAAATVAEMNALAGVNQRRFVGPYAIAASNARYVIERADWQGAADLPLRPGQFAYADAMIHFARAIGAARVGKPDAAKADIAMLATLSEKLRDAKDVYWSGQVDIQRQVAAAWVLHAEGKFDDAQKALSAAAEAEDKTEKHPVTPGVPKPARELYGDMLLERGKAKDALVAFEATLKKEPNRLGALVGAAKAAEKAGDRSTSMKYSRKIVGITGRSDNGKLEVADARLAVKKR